VVEGRKRVSGGKTTNNKENIGNPAYCKGHARERLESERRRKKNSHPRRSETKKLRVSEHGGSYAHHHKVRYDCKLPKNQRRQKEHFKTAKKRRMKQTPGTSRTLELKLKVQQSL